MSNEYPVATKFMQAVQDITVADYNGKR